MNWRILHVDNDEEDAWMMRELLSQMHGRPNQVHWVDSMAAALQILADEAFDIILIDYDLGLQTGFEFIRETQARGVETPMILITGHGSYEVDVEAMQMGVMDYLNKNELTPSILERAIRYAIERKRVSGERERLLSEMKAMTQQLWQSAKLATMGELAASLAHELNNPLAIISLRIESLLGKSCLDAHELGVIQQEVERMASLVGNLLEFSRSGERHVTALNITEEIQKTLELIWTHLNNRHIAVRVEANGEDFWIQADRQQMRQVILNLLTNASDAMPDGGTITIRIRPVEGSAQTSIEIEDTGVGIAAENLSKVTAPFFTTKPSGKGTGLGLAICRRMIEEHYGSLQVTSPGLGKGTTVQIILPDADRDQPVAKPDLLSF